MEVLLGVGIAILSLLGIAFARIVTTTIHELGHTISALALSKGPVEMYVGSYGDEKTSLKLKLGRLTAYFSFIIWDLDIGLCRVDQKVSSWKMMLITLSGPILSLIFAIVALFLLMKFSDSGTTAFIIAILMVSSFWDFIVNLIPRETETELVDGTSVQNDGKQLVTLFQLANATEDYHRVLAMLNKEEYDEALDLINQLLKENQKSRKYWETKLDILVKKSDMGAYLTTYSEYVLKFDPKVKYVDYWADIKIKKHDYDEVIKVLTQLIYNGKGNYNLYYRRGKALVELGEYTDALQDFHALTLGDSEDPRALANRAYCQFRLGYKEEALEDVMEAVENGKNHLGEIYYLAGVILEETDQSKALEFYKKAVALEYNHHGLAFNISRLQQ